MMSCELKRKLKSFFALLIGLPDEEESGENLPYFEDDGSVCAYYNKNAKWDWYEKGGRWAYYLTTKSGEVTNCCKLKDLDFSDL